VLCFPSFALSWVSIMYLYVLCPHVTYFSTTQTSMPPAGFEPAIPASNQLYQLRYSALPNCCKNYYILWYICYIFHVVFLVHIY
jgi:hypothetical protein